MNLDLSPGVVVPRRLPPSLFSEPADPLSRLPAEAFAPLARHHEQLARQFAARAALARDDEARRRETRRRALAATRIGATVAGGLRHGDLEQAIRVAAVLHNVSEDLVRALVNSTVVKVRRRSDRDGKILELKAKGWSNRRIANHCRAHGWRCSLATVKRVLARELSEL